MKDLNFRKRKEIGFFGKIEHVICLASTESSWHPTNINLEDKTAIFLQATPLHLWILGYEIQVFCSNPTLRTRVFVSNPKADESVAMTFPTTMNDPVSYSQGREKRLALKPYLICKASSVHQSMMPWKKSPFF